MDTRSQEGILTAVACDTQLWATKDMHIFVPRLLNRYMNMRYIALPIQWSLVQCSCS